jgi:hypothetical protein
MSQPHFASVQTVIHVPARVAPGQPPVKVLDIAMHARAPVTDLRLQPGQATPDLGDPLLKRPLLKRGGVAVYATSSPPPKSPRQPRPSRL